MRQALYRKYRSKSLSEIAGQQHVTDTLARALKNGRISHAYLLTGPRGVGKTSIARILAHEINELPYDDSDHLDIIEIDAASNNSVEDVRDLREKVQLAPISAKRKIYIIDEVHMLSKSAFNALLKTLEEPPEHVVFILATTEVHKLPDTILSRTQRFHFRPIQKNVMKQHLSDLAKKEKISLADDALEIIAERADGSFRDGISLLDQLSNISDKKITAEIIESSLGIAPKKLLQALIEAIDKNQLKDAMQTLAHLEESGVSPVILSEQLILELKTLLVAHPQFITLIDSLIEVGRSYNPNLKLLAIVANATVASTLNENDKVKLVSNPKSVALAVKTEPSIITEAPRIAKKSDTTIDSKPKTIQSNKPMKDTLKSINWQEVIEYIRAHHTPLFGVLKNAESTYKDGRLKLHFTYSLHKKKLDDGKYRQLLTECLINLYNATPEIITTSGKLPPRNEQARDVAAIMGGGEEVNV